MMKAGQVPVPGEAGLGLIAGAGCLPRLILEQVAARQGRVFLARLGQGILPPSAPSFQGAEEFSGVIAGTLDIESYRDLPRLTAWLRTNGVAEVCLVGAVRKPGRSELLSLRLLPLLLHMGAVARSGRAKQKVQGRDEIQDEAQDKAQDETRDITLLNDSALLDLVKRYFARHGLTIIAPQHFLPNLLAESGVLGKHRPSRGAVADIEKAVAILKGLSGADLGQGLVIANGLVLGMETALGTAALLQQVAATRSADEKGGVLVKCARVNQDFALDLPSIGVETIDAVVAAGLSGVAVQAGASYLLERETLLARADAAGVFVQGISAE